MEQLDLSPKGMDRRIFIKGMGWITVGLLAGFTLGGCEGCAEQIKNRPVRRRLRTGSAEVDAVIEVYKEAIRLMKDRSAKNAADPLGLAAQAGIHGTESGGFNLCQHGTNHFFSWHRAYLVWFERICQELTGDKTFGLPYWNWNQDPAIHAAFLDTNSVLYMARTRTTMAGQFHVASSTLDPMFNDTNFFTFYPQIEGTPHNRVHSYIGGTLGTGGSAIDPLFWMHHCMIDYCWYKWNIEMGRDNPNDPAWLNENWTHFYDASGNPTDTNAVSTLLMPLFSYQYESSAIGSNPAKAEPTDKKDFKKLEDRIRKGADIKLDIKQRIRLADTVELNMLKPFTTKTTAKVSEFAQLINNDRAKESIFASVGYASLPPDSDFYVRVFVNYPNANVNTPITDPHFAGSFAFFGTDTGGQGHGDHKEHSPQFLVNITTAIERLRKSGELKDGSEISIHLVNVPNGESFVMPDRTLKLTKIDLIVTPVLISSQEK